MSVIWSNNTNLAGDCENYKIYCVILWLVVRNIGLHLHFCHWAPKTLETSKVIKAIKVSFIMLTRCLLEVSNYVIRALELLVSPLPPLHHHHFQERKRHWRLSSITKGQWFAQLCLCNESSIETQKDRVWRSSRLVNTCWLEESGALERTWKLLSHSPYFALCISSVWLTLSGIFL